MALHSQMHNHSQLYFLSADERVFDYVGSVTNFVVDQRLHSVDDELHPNFCCSKGHFHGFDCIDNHRRHRTIDWWHLDENSNSAVCWLMIQEPWEVWELRYYSYSGLNNLLDDCLTDCLTGS